jgi:RHS repeat-associated protein
LGLAFSVDTQGNLTVYHTDGLGSVRALTDSNGNLVQTYQADEFGVPALVQGTSSQPFGYAGQQTDAESGLQYLRARTYDPGTGRFLQRDPMPGSPTHPQTLNPYAYAGNDPTTLADPSGQCPVCIAVAALEVVGVTVAAVQAVETVSDPRASFKEKLLALGMVVLALDPEVGVTEGAVDAVEGADLLATAAESEETALADSVAGGACSFSADTPVDTSQGQEPIGALHPGDVVVAFDAATGATEDDPVTAVLRHLDPVMEELTIGGETIETTPEHPFDTKEKGWAAAGQLWPGAHVRRADGSYGVVRGFLLVRHPQTMYNLTVARSHTFFVGRGRWLVHNTCDFLVAPGGDVIPVPDGAAGPSLTENGRGFEFTNGAGGKGLNGRVTEVRVMDPTGPRGPSPGYPNGYVSYSNTAGQAVDPYTGRTVSPSDPWWHIPLH